MLNITDKYFNTQLQKSVVLLQVNFMILLENETYAHKDNLIDFLDEIGKDRHVDVLIVSDDHQDYSLDKYREKWTKLYENEHFESNILRVFRTFDELYVKIKGLKKTIISINKNPMNATLFNFSMVADLRFVGDGFFVDNNNINMANIPKGGAIYTESILKLKNPFKLLFLLDKIDVEELYSRQLIDRVIEGDLLEEAMKVAHELSGFDYIELETVKILDHKRLKIIERALQQENEFLISCIRTKINQ